MTISPPIKIRQKKIQIKGHSEREVENHLPRRRAAGRMHTTDCSTCDSPHRTRIGITSLASHAPTISHQVYQISNQARKAGHRGAVISALTSECSLVLIFFSTLSDWKANSICQKPCLFALLRAPRLPAFFPSCRKHGACDVQQFASKRVLWDELQMLQPYALSLTYISSAGKIISGRVAQNRHRFFFFFWMISWEMTLGSKTIFHRPIRIITRMNTELDLELFLRKSTKSCWF